MHGVREKLENLLPFLQEVEVRLLRVAFITANFRPGHILL
jgi:hypothetical protein